MAQPFNPDVVPDWLASLWPKSSLNGIFETAINDDDCAVMKFGEEYLVLTTDFINAHPIAAEHSVGGMRSLGRLVFASNLSDLCGSGARPLALLIGITLPYDATLQQFEELVQGVKEYSEAYNVPVIGGDTKLGSSTAIYGVGVGRAKSKKYLFLKNGAIPGDSVWVSGFIGSCSAAIIGISHTGVKGSLKTWAKEIVSNPQIPLAKSEKLSDLCIAHSGMDISDGLSLDLHRLCKASEVGCELDVSALPVHPNVRKIASLINIPAWKFCFGVGGDFQFLVTTTAQDDLIESLGFTKIGRITEGNSINMILPNGLVKPLPVLGHSDSNRVPFLEENQRLIEAIGDEGR